MNPKTLNKEDMTACLPHLFAAVEDRGVEVRKGANDAVLPFMIHLGYDAMARHAGKLKVSNPSWLYRVLRILGKFFPSFNGF